MNFNSIGKRATKLTILAICVLLVVSLTACGDKEIVAKGENINITKDDLYDLLVEQYGEEALNSLIGEKIVEAEIEKQKIKVTDEEIEKQLNDMKEHYGGEEALNEAMAYYGYTMDDLKKNITINIQMKKVLEPYIKITDEEVQAYFNENKDALGQKEQVKASHILVESKELADEIKEKIVAGEDFATLAKEHSTDGGSKESGGELGYFPRGKMVKEFEEAAFSLEKGAISEPIKTTHGYHIIKVEDKKQAKEATLKDSEDVIREALIEKKIPAAYEEWYQKKYEEYKIENLLQKENAKKEA